MGVGNSYKEEKYLDNTSESMPIDKLKIINEQSEKCICRILGENKSSGTGFLCLIPFPDKLNLLPVLITNYHVLKDLYEKKSIEFTLNNDKTKIILTIDNSRKIYENENYDIIIIEILKKDNLDFNSFLEIDDKIFAENSIELYRKSSIYVIYYPGKFRAEFSFGIIKDISEFDYNIQHLCSTKAGGSGCPIINSSNNRVIGIHKGASKKFNFNLGTFLKEPIKKFYSNNNTENKNFIDEIVITYKIEKKEEISNCKLFGEKFVENNKNNCLIIYKDQAYKLDSYLKINENNLNEKNEKKYLFYDFKIKLKGINNITDASYMFYECVSLKSMSGMTKWNTSNITNLSYFFYECQKIFFLPDLSKWNTSNVTNLSHIFYGCHFGDFPYNNISKWDTKKVTDMGYIFGNCSSLKRIADISNWNTKNVTNMEGMFAGCSNLTSLPDISKWETKNITNMQNIFSGCSNLTSLPDISNWETKNITNMQNMFKECSNLTSLPDISNWETKNITNTEGMFAGCSKITSLPDISNWETKNITNMQNMFKECSNLISLPDISKWNIKNVTNINNIFSSCRSLQLLPDISKWDTSNINNMRRMFDNCLILENLPDISKWNTSNVTDMSYMFIWCQNLRSLPDISRWDISNVENMNSMFERCYSLSSFPNIAEWNTRKVKFMNRMFYKCISLNALPNIKTENVVSMRDIFYRSNKIGIKLKNTFITEYLEDSKFVNPDYMVNSFNSSNI